MIPVTRRPEPPRFDALVRQPGLKALAGETAPLPPLWRECLPDLLAAYERICAYVSVYIPPCVGAASTDHFVAKSSARNLTYEWSNYRLACSRMNARKGAYRDLGYLQRKAPFVAHALARQGLAAALR